MKGNSGKEEGQIRVSIDYNKQKWLMKFPRETKVLYL
jgi:hypothetical protein